MKKIAFIFALICYAAFADNEISVSWTFTAAKGPLSITRQQSKQYGITNAAPNVSEYTIAVTTNAAGTPILPRNVSTNGWGWLVNDSTNYSVDVGAQVSGVFYPAIELQPGEGLPIRSAPGITNFARANSGTNGPLVLECPIIDN